MAQATDSDSVSGHVAGRSGATVATALKKVEAFIPTEAVGVYVAATGILLPKTAIELWILFGIGEALVLVLILVGRAEAAKQAGKNARPIPMGKTIELFLLASISFTAWCMALPKTPFDSIITDASRIGAIAVLVLAAVLPRYAKLRGLIE